jgi:hypothetical protein
MYLLTDYKHIATSPKGIVILKFDSNNEIISLHGIDRIPVLAKGETDVEKVADHLLHNHLFVPGVEVVVCQAVVGYDPRYVLLLYPHFYLNKHSVQEADDTNWPVVGLLQQRFSELIAPKEVAGKFAMFVDLAKDLKPLRELYRTLLLTHPNHSNLEI